MTALDVVTRPLELRLRHTFRIARGASDSRLNVLVEVAQAGRLGRGEAAPILRYGEDQASATAAVQAMAPRLGDARHFASAAREAAVAGQAAAEAAVDIALHDLAAQRCGVPLYEMLGLDPARVPATSFTIGIDSPEVVAEKVREASSYEVLKIKLGGPNDREMLAAVRDTTRQRLRVDANEGWTPETALERLEWLAGLGVEYVEQPLPAAMLAETRELRKRSPLPFYADESIHRAADIPKLAGAFDGINIKLMKCGGLAEALRMIAVARAHGMGVMLGCMIESSVAITAAAHISALVDHADLDGALLLAEDPFVGAVLKDGRVVPPDVPGLGVRPRS
ncbi:MAG: dipeptide epimerase [Vicinamibacteria bacterium]|nr:dipeptide epimerase [Vicinamibacteria bacterium]